MEIPQTKNTEEEWARFLPPDKDPSPIPKFEKRTRDPRLGEPRMGGSLIFSESGTTTATEQYAERCAPARTRA